MIYKCNDCGRALNWNIEQQRLVCSCGSTNYKEIDNTSEVTCDICGSRLNTKDIVQLCENCGSSVVNVNNKDFSGISLAKVKPSEIKNLIDNHINKYGFAKNYNRMQYKLVYLPYWLVDGECRITSKLNSMTMVFENEPVYAGKDNILDYNNLDFNSGIDDVRKFDHKYLFGSVTKSYDMREQIITRQILTEIKKEIKKYLDDKNVAIESVNIEFEPIGKMLVLLPIYEVNLDKYTLYINAQTGKVFGDVPTSIQKVAVYKLLKYTALAFAVFTLLFMGGALQV